MCAGYGYQNLVQADRPRTYEILHPKRGNGKVAVFAGPASLADAYHGSRVGVHAHLDLEAQILGQALEAQRFGGTFDDARQFRLTTAQSHNLLRCAPVLDQLAPQHW